MDISIYIDTRIFCTITISTTVVYMYPSVDPLVSKLNVLLDVFCLGCALQERVVAVNIHSRLYKAAGE